MKTLSVLMGVVLLSISTITASAQNNRNFQDENQRIRQGVRSGQLTAAETYRLKQRELQIRNEATRYKLNDGRIGPRERADLRRDNRQLNRQVFRQKHDCQRRRS